VGVKVGSGVGVMVGVLVGVAVGAGVAAAVGAVVGAGVQADRRVMIRIRDKMRRVVFMGSLSGGVRVFGVQFPLAGIIADVLADFLQFGFAADNMFIIIALPAGLAGGVLNCVDAAGRK